MTELQMIAFMSMAIQACYAGCDKDCYAWCFVTDVAEFDNKIKDRLFPIMKSQVVWHIDTLMTAMVIIENYRVIFQSW